MNRLFLDYLGFRTGVKIKIEIFGSGFLAQEILKFYSSTYPHVKAYLSPRSFLYAHANSREFQKEQIREFAARGPDFIVNAAGPTSIPDSFVFPEQYLGVPSSITRFLIDASKHVDKDLAILQISTASVYGDCSQKVAREETRLNPLSPYAVGKARADDYLAENASSWIILRSTSIYSNSLDKRVLGRLRSGLINSERVILGGTGHELRDFMHVNDFSRALLILAQNRQSNCNVFLIGCGLSLQISEVARMAVCSSTNNGLGFAVEFDQTVRPGDPFAMVVDISKSRLFDFSPEISPVEGLRRYFEVSV